MAIVLTEEEYADKYGRNLGSLKSAIEEARNDAITKEAMNRNTITTHNITEETERFMRDYIRIANSGKAHVGE